MWNLKQSQVRFAVPRLKRSAGQGKVVTWWKITTYFYYIQSWPKISAPLVNRIQFFLKPSQTTWWCRFFVQVFWPRDSAIFSSSPAVVLGESLLFSHSNSPPHRALGWYIIHTSSSRQFHNRLCWLEFLNYCPDSINGDFHCSNSFLKATALICEAQLSFAAHQKYISSFFSCFFLWWIMKWIWTVFPPIYISVKQEAMAGSFHVHNHSGVLKMLNMNGNILQRYFTQNNF